MKTLHDGREVADDSDEWRHECECRAIAALPTLADRRAWLESLEKRRGLPEVQRIRETMKKLWEKRKNNATSRA
jgi:hypothetical protein